VDLEADLEDQLALNFTEQLLAGVEFMHQNQIAHLDIKPDNLVVDENDNLRIIDFGIAVHLKGLGHMVEGFLGTKGWVAPEVVKGNKFDPILADRYAVGLVIHKRWSWALGEGECLVVARLMDKNPSLRHLLPLPPQLSLATSPHTHSQQHPGGCKRDLEVESSEAPRKTARVDR
jgi:serine/threonine protein kinase